MSTPQRFTVKRRPVPLDYTGVNHARSTPSVETLPEKPLQMILRLLRLVGAGNEVRIRGGVRGVAWYFGWPGPNGSLKKHLATLSSGGHIEYRWDGTDLVITVLVPDEITERSGQINAAHQDAPQPTAPPAPAPRSDQIAMNHDHQQGVEGDTPTAFFSPQQTLLYAALLAEGNVKSRSHAFEAAQGLPTGTISDFRDQVAYAAERGKDDPIGFVISFWRDGRQFRRPPQRAVRSEEAPDGRGGATRNRRDRDRRSDRAAHRGAAPHAAPGGDATPEPAGSAGELPPGPIDIAARRAAFLRRQAQRC